MKWRLQHERFTNRRIPFCYVYNHYMSNTSMHWWSILVTWWTNKIIQSTGWIDNETQTTEWIVLKILFSVRLFILVRSFIRLFIRFVLLVQFYFILFWRVKYLCVGVWTYKLYWNQLDAIACYVNTSNQLTYITANESYRIGGSCDKHTEIY